MSKLSEIMTEQFRGNGSAQANPDNPITRKRRSLYNHIQEQTGGDPKGQYDFSIGLINNNRPLIEKYIIHRGESPSAKVSDLAVQAYKLRCDEIETIAKTMGVPESEAGIFIEDDESSTLNPGDEKDGLMTGALFAPIGIAAHYIESKPDNADTSPGAGLISGLLSAGVGLASQKINAGDLMRAAQNKPAGIFGLLGQGGTTFYNGLRAYLNNPANVQEKQEVLNGQITDTSQLAGYAAIPQGGLAVTSGQVVQSVAQNTLKQYLPYIILGVIVFVLIIVYATKGSESK